MPIPRRRILISGGGIAGLTLAISLKSRGFEPLVIEREPALRGEGYMMDFFGTGWDVAERMGLIDRLRGIRYPIDAVDFVDASGRPYLHVPITRIRAALDGKYVYLRRQDLEAILADRAQNSGVPIRYGTSIAVIEEQDDRVRVRFDDGAESTFWLVVGADGVHSRVRELVFGPEAQFARFLGLTVAAFHLARDSMPVMRAATVYEETNRLAMIYPLDVERLDATFILRSDTPHIPHHGRADFLRERLAGGSWLVPQLARAIPDEHLYFDTATQIVMPEWHRGRVVLIGDACGCMTLLAAQGSHMAMADAFILADELHKRSDHREAFSNYQRRIKPHVERKQKTAARWASVLVPGLRSWPWLRRLSHRVLFSRALIRPAFRSFGSRSILET
jgi:2-polyprenyl-6-methoxyphenol hydroxylase-like FAD-dependent oxidoreductase